MSAPTNPDPSALDVPIEVETVEKRTITNKLELLPQGMSFLPQEWRNLGTAYTSDSDNGVALTGRCNFVVREGFDAVDQSSTGRVLEGMGEWGATLRKKSLAFSLSMGGLSWFSGLDDPNAQSAASSTPALKATVAKEFGEDQFVALSYDFKFKKPEVSMCWSGSSFTERATLCVHADPMYRTYRLGAAVELPGPEWRDTVYDELNDVIEEPKDDGARHRMWVQHTVKDRDWNAATCAGVVMDLGRMINYVCDFIDYKIEPLIPPMFWSIPLSRKVFNVLVPSEDSEQVRHKIKNWDVEVTHDFARSLPKLGVSKHLKYATLAGTYDLNSKEAGVEYVRDGFSYFRDDMICLWWLKFFVR